MSQCLEKEYHLTIVLIKGIAVLLSESFDYFITRQKHHVAVFKKTSGCALHVRL